MLTPSFLLLVDIDESLTVSRLLCHSTTIISPTTTTTIAVCTVHRILELIKDYIVTLKLQHV